MADFVISTFLKIMQEGLVEHSSQEACAAFIFEPIINQDKVKISTNLDSKKISRLISRTSPVPSDYKEATQNSSVISIIYDYFEDEVINDLNPHTELDTYSNVLKAINTADNVSDEKKEEFKNLYEEKDYSVFLAEAFIYSLQKDNVLQKSNIVKDDYPLLNEVNFKCPIKHIDLIENKNNKTISKYEIVQIFPEDLTDEESEFFSMVSQKPTNFNDSSNLIALSLEAAREYRDSCTVESFKSLLDLKKHITTIVKANRYVDNVVLENEIRSVIEALESLSSSDELIELRYEALNVADKVHDFITQQHVKTYVVQYYKYIESLFKKSEMDFDGICLEVRNASYKLENSGLSQEEIIRKLSEWIHNKAFGDKNTGFNACEIVVCFFIQNCEVFSNDMAK